MRILHVFRSPVGGLFRHVRDLAQGQSDLGHDVGLFCDSSTGGANAERQLADCRAFCTGGVATRAISRLPGPSDVAVMAAVRRHAAAGTFDIIHGHGAKGGLLARMVGRKLGISSVYSPHGGSLHYAWRSPAGAIFLGTEKFLARMGSGFVFVCDYEKQLFAAKVGLAGKPSVVAHNGLWPAEFQAVRPAAHATDLVFVGEVRHLKGIDMLLAAVREIGNITLTVVGDGPELENFTNLSKSMGLSERVAFAGRLPIRQALSLGRLMLVPSRNESFPYVVLETAAAAVPMIATNVGGIPEVLPGAMLCEPNAAAIADAIRKVLANPALARRKAEDLSQAMHQHYSVATMAGTITNFYGTLGR